MRILAIETSCDDTGIAILEVVNNGTYRVLANLVSSQIEVHKEYGGVYPAMAKRAHQKNLMPTFTSALKAAQMLSRRASPQKGGKLDIVAKILEREPELLKKIIPFFEKYKKPEVDAIAVTNGPGLEPCLWVGINFAKALSYFWNLPLIDVNHIKAHIFVNTLNNEKIIEELKPESFPLIALVVSGGHTQLVLMPKLGKYEIIGETRDDEAGECFDKCAKILGLGYPGGPIISALAEESKKNFKFQILNFKLPRPMMGSGDYDFSFSGLKTAVLYRVQKDKNKTKKYKQIMAAEVQQAIIDVLIKKTVKAARDHRVKTIILGGGVSANQELRKQFSALPGFKIIYPPANLSTDNGLMVAIAGYFKIKQNKFINWQDIEAKANLRVE